MPDDMKMRRTQIYLTDRQSEELKRIASLRGVPASALIREAVDEKLAAAAADTVAWKGQLARLRGMWAGRSDVESRLGAIRREMEERLATPADEC